MTHDPAPLVLVVDDDHPNRLLMERVLAHAGYRVAAIAEPPAVGRVARHAPDLIVLDYWFGREPASVPFLAALRADPATARVPVLLVTAAVPMAREARERLDGLPVDGVLFKPFRPDELLAKATACLAAARAVAG